MGEQDIKVKSTMPVAVIDYVNWELTIKSNPPSIYFIDDDIEFIKTKEFYKCVIESESLFVLIGRNPEFYFNYSIDDIYKFEPINRVHILKKKYDIPKLAFKYCNDIITNSLNEDSGSGFQFYDNILKLNNYSIHGNRGFIGKNTKYNNSLLIIGRVSFGRIVNYLINKINTEKLNVILLLQNSFEYEILVSGILGNNIDEFIELEQTLKLESIDLENIYYQILVEISTNIKDARYSKSNLKSWYFDDNNIDSIVKTIFHNTGVNVMDYRNENLNEDKNILNWGL